MRYHEVFGFFIEAPRSAAKQIPEDYERRATISHAERYVTPELKAREASILSTEDRVNDLEVMRWGMRGKEAMGDFALRWTARLLPWYEDYFRAPYHYDKYDQVAVRYVPRGRNG